MIWFRCLKCFCYKCELKCGDSVCEGLNGCEGVRCQGVDLMVCGFDGWGLVGVDW